MTAGDRDPQRRTWVTAKGLRALGLPVPEDIADDDVVILMLVVGEPVRAS